MNKYNTGSSVIGRGWTRVERKFQIVRVLLYDAFDNEEGRFLERWYTTREIAAKVGLKPTAYLLTMLAELVYEKALEGRHGENAAHALRFEYRVMENVTDSEKYHEPFAKYFREAGW